MTDQRRSPEEIEREIAATRSEIDETIDALQEKLSPGQLVDQALGYVKEGGGDFAGNLGRAVRDNPLPLMLIGAGIGWMMFGNRSSDDRSYERVESDGTVTAYRYDPRSRSFYAADSYSGTTGTAERRLAGGAYGAAYDTDDQSRYGTGTTEYGATGTSSETDSSKSTLDRAKGAAASAQESAASAGARVSQKAGALRHAAGSRMSDARHAVGDARHAAGERLSGAASATQEQLHRARERAGVYAEQARHRSAQARENAERFMYDYPLVVGAAAVAVGAAIAAALPATRREHEVLGEQSDAVKARARALAQEQAEEGREVASAALEAGKKEAEAQHMTPGELRKRAEETVERAAEGAVSVAKAATRTAETEAKKRSGQSDSGQSSGSTSSATSGAGASGKTPT